MDHTLILKPSVLQKTNASCIYRAFEVCCDPLSLAKIIEVATLLKLMIISEVPDNVAANNRRMAAYAIKLPANVLYHSGLGCSVHRTHNMLSTAQKQKDLIGDVHAVHIASSTWRHREMMMKALREIVDDELELLDVMNPRWDLHLKDIMEHALCGEFNLLEISGCGHPAAESMMVWATDAGFGDARRRRIQVLDDGRCREEQVNKVTAAISESGLILGVYPDEPAKNRWGTMARHLGAQVAGNMVFEILPRVLQRAFPQWDVPGDEDQRDDDADRLERDLDA